MTLVDVLWVLGLVVAGISAFAFLAAEEGRGRTAPPVVVWLAASALGGGVISFVMIQVGFGADAVLLWSLLSAPFTLPAIRVWGWLETRDMAVQESILEKDALDAARMRYHATDFGVTRPPEPPGATSPPAIARPPPPQGQPAMRASRILQALAAASVLVLWPGAAILSDHVREGGRISVVRAHLAEVGFVDAEVWRVRTSRACWGGQEFYWRSEPGDGAACLRDDDYVTVRPDREIWTTDPFTRPAL